MTAAGTLVSLGSGSEWNSAYRDNPNRGDYAVQVDAVSDNLDRLLPNTGFGLIVCHEDRDNQLTFWVGADLHALELISVIGGTYMRQTVTVRSDLDWTQYHTLGARKVGNLFSFYLDNVMIAQQAFDLISGTPGLVTVGNGAHFRGFGPASYEDVRRRGLVRDP